jgi:hypothetical protein
MIFDFLLIGNYRIKAFKKFDLNFSKGTLQSIFGGKTERINRLFRGFFLIMGSKILYWSA